MSEQYFKKFPTITYNGYQAKNIMARVSFLNRVYNKPEYFYNLELINSERADNISNAVYNDPYLSWLVYLSNGVVDPYYDWNLNQYDFNNFLQSKYGSVEKAQNRVAYWNNNWYDDTARISVSEYNAALDYRKKYYEPIYAGRNILEYKRREVDWVVNTNQVWEYSVDASANVTLDEKVTIYSNQLPVANGQLLFSNSSLVRIHQVFGTTNTYSNGSVTATLSGEVNKVSVNISEANLIAKNISDEEFVYWTPVTYYDVEDIKNTDKQTIRALNKEYGTTAALQLKRLLNK